MQPKIYVACLSAYNAGYLHGAWIDALQDPDDIYSEIAVMLKNSPVADTDPCEDWAIHDFEDWAGLNIAENEDIEQIAINALLIVEHGAAIAAYIRAGYDPEDFEDHYHGDFEDEEDFAYEMLDQDGKISALEKIGISPDYIDLEKYARDLFCGDFWSAIVGRHCFVFSA